jgi:hypothetical protein
VAGDPLHKPPVAGDSYWSRIAVGSYDGYENIGTFTNIAVYPHMPVTIDWQDLGQVSPADFEATVVSTRVYRGRQGRFGFVGETTAQQFVDDGADPDFSCPPPKGTNPFQILKADTSVLRTEEPSVSTLFEGRRVYAATTERPGFICASAVENYSNFDDVVPPKDSDALSFELATSMRETIRALVPRSNGLLVLTDMGEWIVSGSGQNECLTPNSLLARPISQYGSSKLEPLVFGNCVWFLQKKGTIPRCLVADGSGYAPFDVASMSRHLFTGYGINAWCYAEDPYGVVWAVRSDGVLLSCTFNLEQQMVAWTRHEITGATVEDVCTIPDGYEDAVYLVTLRENGRCIEKLSTRVVNDVRLGVFLDASKVYDGRNTDSTKSITVASTGGDAGTLGGAVNVSITGDTGTEHVNKVLRVWEDESTSILVQTTAWDAGNSHYHGYLLEPTVDEAAVSISNTSEWAVCINGLSGLPDFTAYTEGLWSGEGGPGVIAPVETPGGSGGSGTSAPVSSPGSPTRAPVGSGGGSHPVGGGSGTRPPLLVPFNISQRQIYGLADGNVVGPFPMEGGSVTLDEWTAVLIVGQAYYSDFESLSLVRERGKEKVVKEILIETEGSRGGWVGESFETRLTEIPARRVEHGYAAIPLENQVEKVPVRGSYDKGGRCVVRQSSPLPMAIIAIEREVEVGG